MNLENICCPSCLSPLEYSPANERQIRCPFCGAPYVNREGILDFIPRDDFYWGEIDRDRLRTINAQAGQLGDWYGAIRRNLTDRPRLVKYITQPSRLGWLFHCYNQQKTDACLDVGSGWGPISFGLSRFYKNVYSLDRVYERLHFQSIRARLDGIRNIRFMRSDFLKLPFTDQTFDFIALNGVLEWVGMSDPAEEPDELQKRFLEEIARVLKPDGRIYLGIENRSGYQYFLGDADHSGLRYTSLVPRPVADQMVRNAARKTGDHTLDKRFFHKTQQRYRTYTYTLWGYEKLLRRAGFNSLAPYWAWESYSYPRISGSMDAASMRYMVSNLGHSLRRGWQKLALRLILALPDPLLTFLVKLFSPDFLIIAGRDGPGEPSLQDRIFGSQPKPFVRISRGSSPTLETNYVLLDENANASQSILVTARQAPPEAAQPLILAEEESVPGRLMRPADKDDVALAARWLADFQLGSKKGEWGDHSLEQEMRTLVEATASLPDFENLRQPIRQFELRYIHAVRSGGLKVVSEHGDFRPLNLVITPQDDLYPADWRFSRERGVPFMDIGGFYLALLRRASNGDGSAVFPDTDGPLGWFVQGLGNHTPVPYSMTPVYYLLRVIQRIRAGQEPALFKSTAFAELAALLKLALDHSSFMDEQ